MVLEARAQPYLLALSGNPSVWAGFRQHRVSELLETLRTGALLPGAAEANWQRLSAGDASKEVPGSLTGCGYRSLPHSKKASSGGSWCGAPSTSLKNSLPTLCSLLRERRSPRWRRSPAAAGAGRSVARRQRETWAWTTTRSKVGTAGTGTTPSRSSRMPFSLPSGQPIERRNHQKRGLRKPRGPFGSSRASEVLGELTISEVRRLVCRLLLSQRPSGWKVEGRTLVIGLAPWPSGRSQALPLQAQRCVAGLKYNCNTNLNSADSLPAPVQKVWTNHVRDWARHMRPAVKDPDTSRGRDVASGQRLCGCAATGHPSCSG